MNYNVKSITKLIFFGITKFKNRSKKCPNLAKNSLFKKVSETVLFGRVIPVQTFFNSFDCYTFIPTFSESLRSCRPHTYAEVGGRKSNQNWTKNNYNWQYQYFCFQEFLKIVSNQLFLWIARKAAYSVFVGQILALYAPYCTSYTLDLLTGGSKMVNFWVSSCIRSYNSKSIYSSFFKIEI